MQIALALAVVLLLMVVVILALAASRPGSFRVERSATYRAPAEEIYGHLQDFHRWSDWSPWEKLDPNMHKTHGGASSGKGAIYEWKGNKQVGKGRMEILEADPPRVLKIKLDFLEPFEAHNLSDFTLTPEGGGTKLTWGMTGQSPFLFKLMGLFMSMDSMVGKDFERGLANLERLVGS